MFVSRMMVLVALIRDIEFMLLCSMELGKLPIHSIIIALKRQE